MNKTILAVLALTLLGCPPSQFDEAKYGTVSVYIDSAWLLQDQANIRAAMRNLEALGPRFAETEEASRATVRVRRFESPTCAAGGPAGVAGPGEVRVDPVCTPGETAFRATVAHEIGHALGMAHVCRRANEDVVCSPVGYGDALLNPSIAGDGNPPDWSGTSWAAIPEEHPQELDLAEFRRVWRRP